MATLALAAAQADYGLLNQDSAIADAGARTGLPGNRPTTRNPVLQTPLPSGPYPLVTLQGYGHRQAFYDTYGGSPVHRFLPDVATARLQRQQKPAGTIPAACRSDLFPGWRRTVSSGK